MTAAGEKRQWNWLSFAVGVVGALVVLGGIWIGISIDAANKADAHEHYLTCMTTLGYSEDSPVTTDEELDLLIQAADICHEQTGG